MAAGMGNRYGGLKQIDPVGPNGEIIIDYSIYDAINAGFGKLVFVIRHFFEDAFKEKIGRKFDGLVETAYAYQELDACLGDFTLPADRQKPWGTGHAILVARDVVNEPFAVINADDYYGTNSFKVIADYLSAGTYEKEYAMVGYTLKNTLSDYGSVARGVCKCDDRMFMTEIIECTNVEKTADGARFTDNDGNVHQLTGGETVSMNLWGFDASIFKHLERLFAEYLEKNGQNPKGEFYIPFVVDELVENGLTRVKVLPTDDSWFGITYKQDKPIAVASINKLIAQDVYPQKLWEK